MAIHSLDANVGQTGERLPLIQTTTIPSQNQLLVLEQKTLFPLAVLTLEGRRDGGGNNSFLKS